MIVFVNSREHEIAPNSNLNDLLNSLQYQLDGTAIAVNEEIVPKSQYASFVLKENMHIELFSLVAGG